MTKKPSLYIVVPCYNEEEVLPHSTPVFLKKLDALINGGILSDNSRLFFVDDGSKDNTWNLIKTYSEENPLVCGVKLSNNCGHQNALMAGISESADRCDVLITIDADLQDDINCIDKMIEKYLEGFEVVYGVRSSRESDGFFKKFTAQTYYKFLKVLGVDIVYNHADFRLLTSKACKALLSFKEVNLFLRGIVKLIGFKSTTVYYERNERKCGTSKYPLKKMISFGLDGITSFSIRPVRLISVFGGITLVATVIYTIYSLARYFLGETVSGWTSIILSIWFFGSVTLIAIGVIGEYISKIYLETKNRPRFIIEEKTKGDL